MLYYTIYLSFNLNIKLINKNTIRIFITRLDLDIILLIDVDDNFLFLSHYFAFLCVCTYCGFIAFLIMHKK